VQLAERRAVVAPHARDRVDITLARERFDLRAQVVAAPGLELLEHPRREARAVVFVRVVEVRARRARAEAREGLVEAAEVAAEARDGEGVDDVALAARRRALHLLDRRLRDGAVDAPRTRRAPVEPPFGSHAARQLDALARIGNGDDVPRRPERQRLAEPAVLHLAPGQLDARRRLGVAHPRAAERPAGSRREIDAEAEALAFAERVAEHLHEAPREERDVPALRALHAVDRADLDAAEAGLAEELELAREIGFVDRGPEPPPARPGTALRGRRRPRQRRRRRLGGREPGSAREQEGERQPCGRPSPSHRAGG
jgi:hypothetical protein